METEQRASQEPFLEDWGKNPLFWVPRKMTTCQIINDLIPSRQVRGIFVGKKSNETFPIYHKVAICGMIVSVEDRMKKWIVTVDDSTGHLLRCNYFVNGNQKDEFKREAESAINGADSLMTSNVTLELLNSLRIGRFVIVTGRLEEYWEGRCLVVENLYLLKHSNDELLWNKIGFLSF